MMPSAAISQFLERPLDDLHRYKELTVEELDRRIDKSGHVEVTSMHAHQKACFAAGTIHPRMLLFMAMGGGKTKVTLDLLSWRRQQGTVTKRALVLVPNDSNCGTWIAEAAIHQPSLTVARLPLEKVIPAGDVIVSTYARLVRLLTDRTHTAGGKGKWRINKERLNSFADNFDSIVADECSALANPSSLTSLICTRISWLCHFALGLTGTPFGRDPQALYSQFLAIDGGDSLGRNIGIFRAAFFTAKRDFWKGVVYTLKQSRQDDLRRHLRHRSIHYSIDECAVSMPESTETLVLADMSPAARAIYEDRREEVREASINGEVLAAGFIRMRQLATGFAVVEDEDGNRVEVDFPTKPKLEALEAHVTGVPEECKLVIFYEFTRSGRAICEMLDRIGVGHLWLWSGTKDKAGVEGQFRNDDKVRALVVNSKSGGFGLNLQVANYCFLYESPVSPIVREQAKTRVLRQGQKRPVFFYDIAARGTVEERILEYVREGKDLLEAVLQGRERIF